MLRIENRGFGSQLSRIKVPRGAFWCLASLICPPDVTCHQYRGRILKQTKIRSARGSNHQWELKSENRLSLPQPSLTRTKSDKDVLWCPRTTNKPFKRPPQKLRPDTANT